MQSIAKHLARFVGVALFTSEVKMLRYALHDVLLIPFKHQ
ncbi:MAG: hypothetical protein JWR44_3639 [Hymenobacter sp.]|nr:hypothetical protein [Hymenobacter sp.]